MTGTPKRSAPLSPQTREQNIYVKGLTARHRGWYRHGPRPAALLTMELAVE